MLLVYTLRENTRTHYFQNHYTKQTKHTPQGSLYGEIRMSHEGRELGEGTWQQAQIFEHSTSTGYPDHPRHTKKMYPPHSTDLITYWKNNLFLIALRSILSRILPAAGIISHTIVTYLKKFDGTKFFKTKQCPAGLSPRIIPQVFHS